MKVKLDTRKLREMIEKSPARIDAAVKETALAVEARAKVAAPRDPARPPLDPSRPVTGFLRGSIAADPVEPGHWLVNVGAEYGLYQEMGTSRIPARPFLGPAVEAERQNFISRLAEALNR